MAEERDSAFPLTPALALRFSRAFQLACMVLAVMRSLPALHVISARMLAMHALKARVENGRLKLDEPTDLPEGKLVDLVPLDEVFLGGGDDLDDEERAALDESIREGIADMEAGRTTDAKAAIAKLRSRP